MDIGSTRQWTGKPSTTQLLNGTRMTFLQITKDYAIQPYEQAFALLGTRHHHRLEKVALKVNALSEEQLGGDITGILDLLVPDENSEIETYELWDYKTSGSFQVAKALGLQGVKVPDPTGAVYQKSGNWGKAGSPKMITIWEEHPENADMDDWILQLNHYRLKIEALGFPVSWLIIQDTVRDGGTSVSLGRGVTEKIYKIPIPRMDNQKVLEYFGVKAYELETALLKNELPLPCSNKETWDGRRCEKFCAVSEFCDCGTKESKQKKKEGDGKTG
jgi:hypothetical protein